MLFFLILFLHIATMFTAVAVSYGGVIFFLVALRTGDTQRVRAMTASAKPIARAIPILYVAGGALGLLAAIVTGYNLLAPWLIIAYVLFVVLMVIGALFTGRTIDRIGEDVASAPDGPLPTAVTARTRQFYQVEVFDFLLLFVIIFDMVVKPFS